jgi:hypothetical protein
MPEISDITFNEETNIVKFWTHESCENEYPIKEIDKKYLNNEDIKEILEFIKKKEYEMNVLRELFGFITHRF